MPRHASRQRFGLLLALRRREASPSGGTAKLVLGEAEKGGRAMRCACGDKATVHNRCRVCAEILIEEVEAQRKSVTRKLPSPTEREGIKRGLYAILKTLSSPEPLGEGDAATPENTSRCLDYVLDAGASRGLVDFAGRRALKRW